MLLLSSVTASFAGDRTTKAMTTAQDGKAAALSGHERETQNRRETAAIG